MSSDPTKAQNPVSFLHPASNQLERLKSHNFSKSIDTYFYRRKILKNTSIQKWWVRMDFRRFDYGIFVGRIFVYFHHFMSLFQYTKCYVRLPIFQNVCSKKHDFGYLKPLNWYFKLTLNRWMKETKHKFYLCY